MELSAILPHVEALIFASEKPLTSLELTELINNALGFLDDKITLDQIEASVAGVIEKYDADFYPFEIRESGGGWQFLTKKDYHKTVAQLNGDKFLKRLSAASLETLAIIAYKQPITKGEIESIRGVNSDYSIQKLLEKELIIITGRNEDLPGKPLVYATSKTFMDYFGINSPDELPSIKDVLSSQVLEPTPVPQHVSDGLFAGAASEDEVLQEGGTSLEDEELSEDLVEGDLVVRANGELTEEPEVVIEDMAEVIEPEQVMGEDEPDDAVADRIDEESGEDSDGEESDNDSDEKESDEVLNVEKSDEDFNEEQSGDNSDDEESDSDADAEETTAEDINDPADQNNSDDINSGDEDPDPNQGSSPEKD